MLVKTLKKLSVKSALAIICLICILVPSAVITTLLVSNQYDTLVHNSINTVNDNLAVIAASVDTMLMQEVETTSETLLFDHDLHEMLHEAAQEECQGRDKLVQIYLLNQHISRVDPYGDINKNLSILLDENGRIYNVRFPAMYDERMQRSVESLCSAVSTNYTNLEWFPMQDNLFDASYPSPRYRYVVPVVRNLISYRNRQYYGKLIMALYEDTIFDCYKNSSLLENGCVYIVDREGNLISHSDTNALEEDFSQKGLVQRCLSAPTGGFIDEEAKVYVSSKTANHGQWLCITEAHLGAISREIAQGIIRYLLIAGIVTMIAIVAVLLLARLVVSPFDDLRESMYAAAKHDFSHKVRKRGTKDMVQLIENYNYLLQETNDLIYHKYETTRKQQQAELDALVMQINPHFLYNTLESISWKARNAGIPEVGDMLYCLGKMFNLSVNKGKRMCTLSRELEHVELYLQLQNLRYKNKFRLEVSVEDEELLDYEVTKLILQPIVENSILHGFKNRSDDCRVHIHVQCDGSLVTIFVEDNGCGIPEEQLGLLRTRLSDTRVDYDEQQAFHNQQRGAGIGIINVHQRIRLYYGENYGIEVEASSPEGTCIAVNLPYQKEESE